MATLSPPSPKTIQTLRKRLGETTNEFGARFSRSGRSIEDWEQGRRAPDALCSSLIRDLARRNVASRGAGPSKAPRKKAAKKVARRVAS